MVLRRNIPRAARTQYLTSGHKTIGNAFYANADDCQGCHTNEGFIERAKKAKVDPKKFVSNPSEIGCFTCHAPHDTGNFSFRLPPLRRPARNSA